MGKLHAISSNDERLIDGRQSPRALEVQRGSARLLNGLGFSCIFELTLKTGRRADIVGLSKSGEIWIVEVKSCVQDFRADSKWPDYRDYCDQFYFATLADVDATIFPSSAGLIIGDGFDAEIMRAAPEHKLAPARRKAQMLNIARSSCDRLHRLMDPHLGR